MALNDVFPQFNATEFDYDHLPLEAQLGEYGMRGLELDIYYDPNGGLFYNRLANTLIPEPTESGLPELLQPGFKVLHVPDLDYMTHHLTFKQALQAIKNWSNTHANHLPVFINIETKTEGLDDFVTVVGAIDPIPYTPAAADDLDAEIKSVFGNDLERVITPDRLRANYASLNEAALAGNWQTLAAARGKVVFIIDGNYDFYTANHPQFAGRAMFAYAPPYTSEAAFVIANDVLGNEDSIRKWVEMGYIVRTRSDAGTTEARQGDYTKMNAAFACGAQIISTDYYRPDPRYATDTAWTDFAVHFADGSTARLNPVNAALTTLPSNCLLDD